MLDLKLKELLGYKSDTPDDKVMADWKRRASRVCKPCLEIYYCPYGPLSRGGSSEESNLRVTCRECNRKKADRVER